MNGALLFVVALIALPTLAAAEEVRFYNRFTRAKRGVWETLFRELAVRGRSTQTIRHTQGAPLSLGLTRRSRNRRGRSHEWRNTKIHALADAKGRLHSFLLAGGQLMAARTWRNWG